METDNTNQTAEALKWWADLDDVSKISMVRKYFTIIALKDYTPQSTLPNHQLLEFEIVHMFLREQESIDTTSSKEELLDCIKNLMGVFDSPIGRRKMSDEFSEEARKIGRDILERNPTKEV